MPIAVPTSEFATILLTIVPGFGSTSSSFASSSDSEASGEGEAGLVKEASSTAASSFVMMLGSAVLSGWPSGSVESGSTSSAAGTRSGAEAFASKSCDYSKAILRAVISSMRLFFTARRLAAFVAFCAAVKVLAPSLGAGVIIFGAGICCWKPAGLPLSLAMTFAT